ncbi:MAG: UDP-3-O-(3-hydroxymyristoyl)glucosamine N-acyltransferase [Synechococcales cyanobacterium RM1_1_8]|nr:UDP-3-O-(3-hydroxymyristoyl)glucosamine N-acyltransferase [Synechococcales cyanobacterium RM1_1_8]
MKLSELADIFAAYQGDRCRRSTGPDPEIVQPMALEEAQSGALTYLTQAGTISAWIEKTPAAALILPLNDELIGRAEARSLPWVAVPDPRLAFAQAIAAFYQPYRLPPQIHPTAVIDPSAQLGKDISIGAHVVIPEGCRLGNQVCLHPGVVLYPGVSLGDRTVIHANCTIHERSQIGADCVIQCGAVIGGEGFGFVPVREGWFKMHQSGYVILEDGVEIGCNSTVDRPAVGTTRIGRNTKIDNLVQVGHDVHIGENCAVAAHVGLAGGVRLGRRVILAGQVGVSNRVTIGDGVTVTSKAGVHADVGPGETVSGFPAIPHRLWLRASTLFGRLPELNKAIRQLEQGRSSDT